MCVNNVAMNKKEYLENANKVIDLIKILREEIIKETGYPWEHTPISFETLDEVIDFNNPLVHILYKRNKGTSWNKISKYIGTDKDAIKSKYFQYLDGIMSYIVNKSYPIEVNKSTLDLVLYEVNKKFNTSESVIYFSFSDLVCWLTDREFKILTTYLGEKHTYAEIGEFFDVTHQRISQIYKDTLEKLYKQYCNTKVKTNKIKKELLDLEKKIEDNTVALDLLPIEVLELSVRSTNCLKRAGYNTVEDLLTLSTENVMSIKNMGSKSAEEILFAKDNISLNDLNDISNYKIAERKNLLVDMLNEVNNEVWYRKVDWSYSKD